MNSFLESYGIIILFSFIFLVVLLLMPTLSKSHPSPTPWFGYYHADPKGVEDTRDHTTAVHVQAANPREPLDVIAALHPEAGIVFEFSALTLEFRGDACRYNKCHRYDPARVASILDAVADMLAPYRSRVLALMIVDEMETNPPSRQALRLLIAALRAHPDLKDYRLWANYDNVHQSHSGVPFVLTDGLDLVSLTPNYGQAGIYELPELSRYNVLLEAAARATPIPSLVIVGDGFGFRPDTAKSGLTTTGQAHLDKIDALYQAAATMAAPRGIPVAGEFVFAWDRHLGYPNEYGVAQAPAVIQVAWRKHALRITGRATTCAPPDSGGPSTPAPTPGTPALPNFPTPPDLSNLPWNPR